MDITDSMKESVLFDGQTMYQDRQYNIDENPLDDYNGINIPNHENWRIGQALNEKYKDNMEFPQYVFLSIFNTKLGVDNQYCVRWFGFDDFIVIAKAGKKLDEIRRIYDDHNKERQVGISDGRDGKSEYIRRKYRGDALNVGNGRDDRQNDSLLGQHTKSNRGESSEGIDNQYCVRWYGFDDFEVIARGGKRLEKFRRILEDIKRREKDSYVDECLDEFENLRRKHNRDTLDVGDGREHRRDDSLLGQHTKSNRGESSEGIDFGDEGSEVRNQDREISYGKLTQERIDYLIDYYGADGNYFELVENSLYDSSKDEIGKTTNTDIHDKGKL